MFTYAQKPAKSTVVSAGSVLQRKCDSCYKKKSILERPTFGLAPERASPTMHGVQRSPEQPLNTATRASMDRRFGHDFSRIPLYPKSQVGIQAKLTVNAPRDLYEQEADRVADQVLAKPEHAFFSGVPPHIQRLSGQLAEQMQEVPASIDRALAKPGRPLEPTLRRDMDQRFGYDFSRVRVHTDAAAEQSTHDVNATAYTVGHHIVFGTGRFVPEEHQGRQLIAHELTHVVQQNSGMMAIQRGPGDETDPTNRPASRAAYERYLKTLREAMAKPSVTNSTLKGIIEMLYRDNPEVGSGSTAAAIRNELATGMPTKGTFHLQKGTEMLDKLATWLKQNPTASAGDIATAKNLYLDLQEAVNSGYYADIQIRVTPPSGGPGGAGEPSRPVTIPSGEITVPKPESRLRAGLRAAKGGFAEGLKGAFSAESIAAEIPLVVLHFADRAAAREAIRTIQIKFAKEGFAKGVAAGVLSWPEELVQSDLKNRVTSFRVEGLGDPAGLLTRARILEIAEAYENYAVDIGYQFSSSKTPKWKNDVRDKGFTILAKQRYYFGEDPQVLFKYKFIDKLAYVLRHTTNPIVEKAIK